MPRYAPVSAKFAWNVLTDENLPSGALTLAAINPLAPELFFFLILAHPVYKMWIIQEPNNLALWNKLHFEEEKKTESIEHV